MLQRFDFNFSIFKLLQELKGSFVSFINFFLELQDVISGLDVLRLELFFCRDEIVDVILARSVLVVDVLLVLDGLFMAKNDAFMGYLCGS